MTSACTLPCAREGAACAMMGRRALLIAEDAKAAEALAATLRLLGLEVLRPARNRLGTPLLPSHVDLLLAAGLPDLRAAGDLVALCREERPWVPMIVARPGGMAILLDAERGIDAPPSAAGEVATLVVRAACRTARHHRPDRSFGAGGRAIAPPPA